MKTITYKKDDCVLFRPSPQMGGMGQYALAKIVKVHKRTPGCMKHYDAKLFGSGVLSEWLLTLFDDHIVCLIETVGQASYISMSLNLIEGIHERFLNVLNTQKESLVEEIVQKTIEKSQKEKTSCRKKPRSKTKK